MSTVKALFLLMQGFRIPSLGLKGIRKALQDWKHIEKHRGSVGRCCDDLLERFEELFQSRVVYAYNTITEDKLCRLTVTVPFEVVLEQLRCFQDSSE